MRTRRLRSVEEDAKRSKDSAYYRQQSKEARERLSGRPAPVEWEKGGVTKRLNPNRNPGGMTRLDIRELTFRLAVRKRAETTAKGDHSSKFTKPGLGARAAKRARQRQAARDSRRRNRR